MRVLFVDVGTNLKTVRDLERQGRGGMVTSLFRVTDYLSSKGVHTYVWSDIEQEGQTKAGTNWINEPYGRFDVLVSNRGTGSGYPYIDAKSRVLWTHDLPHNGFIPDPKTIRGFQRTVFMSRYAERVWRTFYRTIGRSVIIPNGVDDYFKPGDKDPGLILYASAPNRGLDKLPLIAGAIEEACKYPIKVRAYSNLAKLHPGEARDGDDFDYEAIRNSTVDLRDPIPQKMLAQELGRAGLMVLPSDYPEICSNIVLQALRSGVPIVTTGKMGATPEWVKHRRNGMLTQLLPHDYMAYQLEVARNALEVLNNPRLHAKLIRGAVNTKIPSWERIGAQWLKLIRRLG